MIPNPGSDHQPPQSDQTTAAAKGPIAATTSTPLSLVVSNVSLLQQHQASGASGCSAACLHEKRIIRRDLQKWGKNVVYLVGFESVAREFVGPRRWKKITSGLPCPPSSSSSSSTSTPSSGTRPAAPTAHDLTKNPVSDPSSALFDDQSSPFGNGQVIREEPVDWDPEKSECFNCILRKSKLSILNPEVPDSTDITVSGKLPIQSSPLMKQSNERVCSCDPHDSCVCSGPESPAEALAAAAVSSPEDRVDDVILTSSHLLDQLSSHKSDPSDSGQMLLQSNPNFHLLQQLKKQLIVPSTKLAAVSSLCDQPLDLSFNSTRAQQLTVAPHSSSSCTITGQSDPNSLLDAAAASGCGDTAITSAPATAAAAQKRSPRETTWKRNYSEKELNQALQDILGGKLGTRRAAVIYGIPRSTLRNKVYKLGKGSPVGPGRLPGRRPKSAASATTVDAANTSLSPSTAQPSDGNVPLPDNQHDLQANSDPAIAVKRESHAIPKTRVGRKSGKGRSHEENQEVGACNGTASSSSDSLKQMLRDNIFNKNNSVTSIDRNNNAGNMMSREAAEPSLLLNSQAFMSILPLMMMNQNQFTGVPDPACMSDATNNYNPTTSNPFNQPSVSDQMLAQSNHSQALTASMLSTLDPAAISAIAPLICSYLFNFERLVLASTAASAASASLSATASTLSAANPKSAVPGSAFSDYSSFPPANPFLMDYVQRLRNGAAPEPTACDLVTPVQNKKYRQESSDGPDDITAELEDPDAADECEHQDSENGSVHQTLLNGSFTEYEDSKNKKVDPVILKIPSLKSKKSGTGRCDDHDIKLPDRGLDSGSLLERNLLSLSSNHSNSYASSVNSEESGCEQSVLIGGGGSSGKKGSRSGTASKRVNGCKKSVEGSCDNSMMKNRPKRGRYRNYDREALDKAVAAVQSGEMSVHRAGTHFGVPHSTLEYKVKQRHLLREKKRPATSSASTATAASSNNSSASSPPDATHPLQDPDCVDEPEEKKIRRDLSFESLSANDL